MPAVSPALMGGVEDGADGDDGDDGGFGGDEGREEEKDVRSGRRGGIAEHRAPPVMSGTTIICSLHKQTFVYSDLFTK